MNTSFSGRFLNGASLFCHGFLDLLFPRCCAACGCKLTAAEKTLCLACATSLPLTSLHLSSFNTIHQRLAPEKICRAAAMFFYLRDSPSARIIHLAKYSDKPWLARHTAESYAVSLLPTGFFKDIDFIIPVPLSVVKLLKRGYNQSLYIAQGISNVTGIPILSATLRARSHASQTHKNPFQRYLNTSLIYHASAKHDLHHCHILLVDDVITTGATMLACIHALRQVYPSITISVLSLGVTQLR